MLKAGLRNDACIREWLEQEKKRRERENNTRQKRGDVRGENKDKAKQMSGH